MNRINQFDSPEDVTDVIENYIDDFEMSRKRQKMEEGKHYYRSMNDKIMDRKFYVYAEDENGNPQKIVDPYKANNKLASGFFKLLVDQKVNYLLGNAMAIDSEDREEIGEVVGLDNLQNILKKTSKEASKKAVGWLQVYIDGNGEFGYTKIPAEQVIPIYKANNKDELEMVIRYYKVQVVNDDNEVVKVRRVEVWDDEQVTYYQENDSDELFYMLPTKYMAENPTFNRPYENPRYHFQKDLVIGSSVTESKGLAWGQVPFIPLYNNDEEDTDLQPLKPFIDAYDIVNSDFVNDLENHQDVYWVLKGYEGENLNQFLDMVKKYHAIKVGEGGDVRHETIEIPTEARDTDLQQLEQDIFKFGQGVNPNDLAGGSITNVVIKARFALLDLKCDQFEDKIKEALRKFFEFVNRYREIQGEEQFDIDNINFDRSMIMNKAEMLEANVKQKGNISEQTRLTNHPWVSDVEAEQQRIDEEMQSITLDEEDDE